MNKISFLIYSFLLIVCVLKPQQINAQAPQKFSYQAVLRNINNTLISSTPVSMKISVLQGTSNGLPVYVETQNVISNANGLVTLEIGAGTVVSGTFTAINWATGPYFIKTETDPNGGSVYSITGTRQLISVPYALYSANAAAGSFTHHIGEAFGGGIIFHLWKDSQGIEHGLIVDIFELSASQIWSNVLGLIGIQAQSNWNGVGNSNAIVGQIGHTNSAAQACLNSTNSNQSDWYLPAIDELSLLIHARFDVNKTLSTIAAATSLPIIGTYWSSTEYDQVYAFLFFNSGLANYNYSKSQSSSGVRAVRSF
jgi:hypothetical protein